MWPLNKKEDKKQPKAMDGNPIPGMENDPTEDGNPNVVYDLDEITKEIEHNGRN